MLDGVTVADCVRRLEQAGADVVGLNCGRGPETMIPLLAETKKVCKVNYFATAHYHLTSHTSFLRGIFSEMAFNILYSLYKISLLCQVPCCRNLLMKIQLVVNPSFLWLSPFA